MVLKSDLCQSINPITLLMKRILKRPTIKNTYTPGEWFRYLIKKDQDIVINGRKSFDQENQGRSCSHSKTTKACQWKEGPFYEKKILYAIFGG